MGGFGGAPPPPPPPGGMAPNRRKSAMDTAADLSRASNQLASNTNDGSQSFLDRYRAGAGLGAGTSVTKGRNATGVRQGQLGGAPLTDKYGNLI